jgi:hypothetical protein
MTRPCDDLDLFFDGELPPGERAAFAAHLAGCADCQRELHALMQLTAASAPPAEVVPLAPRRRGWWVAAPLLAAAAAVAVVVDLPGPEDMSGETGEEAPRTALSLAPTRGLEARLSWAPADAHREYAVLRAAGAAGEAVPLAELAALEAAGELRGLAAAHLLRGELAPARALLQRAAASPDRDSDLAALALAEGDAEAALRAADAALAAAPGHAQARWNRALALRELGLPRLAATELARIAEVGEAGWAAEARAQAAALRGPVDAREQVFARAQAAGQALVRDGTAVPEELLAAAPGLARLYFYDALRAAPSRARAEALAGLAASLDARAGGRVLQDLVATVATAAFARRGPLAAEYARLALGEGGDAAALAGRAAAAGQDDLALGASVFAGAAADPGRMSRLAEASGDPWMRMLAAQLRAAREVEAGAFADAERTLLAAGPLCGPGLDYRCAKLEYALAELYALMHRPSDAAGPLAAGLQRAQVDRHWGNETAFLQLRAELARLRGEFGLARAITEETLLRLPAEPQARCAAERHGRDVLAALAIVALDAAGARAALAAAPGCERPPSLMRLFVQADLARLGGDPADARAALDGLAAVRAGPLTPGEAALADHIEGRVRVESEVAAGEALLRRSIAAAREIDRSDPHALKALSFSYASLALAAARRGEHAAALARLAEEVGEPPPTRCALGLVVDHERSYAAALGPDGAATGALARPDPAAPPVPGPLLAALRACPEVAVFARPPFAGRPNLLPPTLAWSYHVGHMSPRTGSAAPGGAGGRLVVADAQPPATLGLPRLAPWRDAGDLPRPALLSGAEATPARVRGAMPAAAEIEFHVHGMVDLGVSDASFLALTPGPDGRHALTAGEIRATELRAAPLVILGACHAGQVAPYLHEAWSLPVAFLEAGARAVIASPAPVQDREAGPFFAAVRAKIRAGASPATAVRDERVRLGADADWAASVLVFE